MAEAQSLTELVAAARAKARLSEDRISEIQSLSGGQKASDAQMADLGAAAVALELNAVDIFSVFEARMQHHFRRGPFAQKLKSLLLQNGLPDLADRVHQYYLAVNVLKHGKGASYRELLTAPPSLFAVTPPQDTPTEVAQADVSLIDVTGPGFFEGLTATILEACHFLENKTGLEGNSPSA